MKWDHNLVQTLRKQTDPAPDVLVIHLGGNNIGVTGKKRLMREMRADIGWILVHYPRTKVLFSSIVQRRAYRPLRAGARSYPLERARRCVNSGMYAHMAEIGHGWIDNSNIRHDSTCYHIDRVHLNHGGNDLLLQNFHIGLRTVCHPLPGW